MRRNRRAAATALRDKRQSILDANATDMSAGRERELSSAMLDRLIRNLSREQDRKAFAEWDAPSPAPTDEDAS